MSDTTSCVIAHCEYWLRVSIALHSCVKEALLDILHDNNYNGLPRDEQQVHRKLKQLKKQCGEKFKHLIKASQWQKLCHTCSNDCASSCKLQNKTNTSDLDITLIVFLISQCTSLKTPVGGWAANEPNQYDNSLSAFVLMARNLRNDINHCSLSEISTEQQFFNYWNRLKKILNGLKFKEMGLFADLKTASLDAYNSIRNTAITERKFEDLSMNLKNESSNEYKNILHGTDKLPFDAPFQIPRENIVVGLSLIEDVKHSDVFIGKQKVEDPNPFINTQKNKLLKESTHKAKDYNDIVKSYDDYVIISGDPGSGKTTLTQTLAYKWSVDQLWSGTEDNTKFDFVFLIAFRDLARFREEKDVEAITILNKSYPGYFQDKKIPPNSLLILDGFDEFTGKSKINNEEEKSPFTRAVVDLIDPTNKELPFTRLLTSRPNGCSILFKFLLSKVAFKQKIRYLKISGFSLDNIKIYIQQHFAHIKTQNRVQYTEDQIKSFSDEVLKSEILRGMMAIPFYCWGVCSLFEEEKSLDPESIPVTYTELFTKLLTVFIRNHGLRIRSESLPRIIQRDDTKKIISLMSMFAFNLETKGLITFQKKDVSKFMYSEEELNRICDESGLILRSEPQYSEPTYQFLHYSFHEFLVAVYVYTNGCIDKVNNIYVLSMVTGLVSGLLESSTQRGLIKSYATNFKGEMDWTLEKVLSRRHYYSCFDFLLLCHEYQNPINLKNNLVVTEETARVISSDLNQQHKKYFLEKVKDKTISISSVWYNVALNSCPLADATDMVKAFSQCTNDFKLYFSPHIYENKLIEKLGTSIKMNRVVMVEPNEKIMKELSNYTDTIEINFSLQEIPTPELPKIKKIIVHVNLSEFEGNFEKNIEKIASVYESVLIAFFINNDTLCKFPHTEKCLEKFNCEKLNEVKCLIGKLRKVKNVSFALSCTAGFGYFPTHINDEKLCPPRRCVFL